MIKEMVDQSKIFSAIISVENTNDSTSNHFDNFFVLVYHFFNFCGDLEPTLKLLEKMYSLKDVNSTNREILSFCSNMFFWKFAYYYPMPIHTDFEQKFIRAQVVAFNDLDALGSKAAAKEKGVLRTEGKDYIVQDGDVIEFMV